MGQQAGRGEDAGFAAVYPIQDDFAAGIGELLYPHRAADDQQIMFTGTSGPERGGAGG